MTIKLLKTKDKENFKQLEKNDALLIEQQQFK